jgi:dihydrofolate synthase/folylpolyglutamate synthase
LTSLEQTRRTLAALNNPQNRLQVIHVAGTNGKGSVCAMLSEVLQKAGYKVGLFTSPHIKKPTERIIIDGVPITESDFSESLRHIGNIVPDNLHFFDIYTAAAYNYFAKHTVDFAIMETGIGGRLDPTNVTDKPILTVITSISFDHQEMLGRTIEKIAGEKAGIIKENVPVVLPAQNIPLLEQTAKKLNAPVYKENDVNIYDCKYDVTGTLFSAELPGAVYSSLRLSLLGKHQLENTAQVLLGIQSLRDTGISIPDEAVYQGLKRVRWPGRFDVLPGRPTVILDGAHNPGSAVRLTQALDIYFPHNKIVLLIAMLQGKDSAGVLHALQERACHIICCQVKNPRALPAENLAALINGAEHDIIPSSRKALKKAKELAGEEGIVLITGSLYLIREFI